MRKGIAITLGIIALLLIGIAAGVYVYNQNKTQDSNMLQGRELAAEKENQNTLQENELVPTAVVEEKISPNCKMIQKQYFKGCDHLIKTEEDINAEYINLTKQEFIEKYLNEEWKLEKFSSDEIVIYQEKEGYCNEHYLVKEHNGVLGIYTLDENGKLTLKEDTEILTMYLPEIDIEKFRQGVEVIGEAELHTLLEDFE